MRHEFPNSVSDGTRFEFQIRGEGVLPGSVPLHKLLDALKCANAAIKAAGGSGVEEGLNLVGIRESSLVCELLANEEAYEATDRLTKSIASGDLSDLPQTAREKVHQLWKISVDNGWEALAFCTPGGVLTLAEIRSEDDAPVWNAYKGLTTLYGCCERVGGSNDPTAQIRLLNGQTIYARLSSKDMAQSLGERLFEIVGLEGEATWDNETQKLIAFRAERLSPFRDRDVKEKPRTITEAFESLAEAAGDRWKDVDPNQFVKELRDE